MSSKLERAKTLLAEGGYTLAAVSGGEELTFEERGVKPLLSLIDGGKSLKGYSAADKVVGKAAALLYVLLGPEELYAGVISRPALAVLEKSGIEVGYGVLTEAIRNRDNTGFCPMETAVKDTEDADEALELIRKKLKELSGK